MSISDDVRTFLSNIAVDNHVTIETRYEEITGALSERFRDMDPRPRNIYKSGHTAGGPQ